MMLNFFEELNRFVKQAVKGRENEEKNNGNHFDKYLIMITLCQILVRSGF